MTKPKVYKDGYELLFKGSGHDPKWTVSVGDSEIIYTNSDIPDTMHFSIIKTTHIMDIVGIGYLGKNSRGEQVTVQVLKEKCTTENEGETYPFSVDVSIAKFKNMGKRGCGLFIEDERLKKEWFLESFKGQEIPDNETGSRPIMKFDTKKHRLNANMGCNGIGGGYDLMENTIYFNAGFMSTQMYCEGIMELERNFTEAMAGKTLKYNFKGNRLIITNLNGVEIMTFSGN